MAPRIKGVNIAVPEVWAWWKGREDRKKKNRRGKETAPAQGESGIALYVGMAELISV
jgi:hypothetical protein